MLLRPVTWYLRVRECTFLSIWWRLWDASRAAYTILVCMCVWCAYRANKCGVNEKRSLWCQKSPVNRLQAKHDLIIQIGQLCLMCVGLFIKIVELIISQVRNHINTTHHSTTTNIYTFGSGALVYSLVNQSRLVAT